MVKKLFTPGHLNVISFCAVECALQGSGEVSVSWMLRAWEYAVQHQDTAITPAHILDIGKLVEIGKNAEGYRRCGVHGGGNVKAAWADVPHLVDDLCTQRGLTPEEWFFNYGNIHPFIDGNGRSGAILYNWLQGTLRDPEWPPNFWNDSRRKQGYGA